MTPSDTYIPRDWKREIQNIKLLLATDKAKALELCLSLTGDAENQQDISLKSEAFHLTGLVYHELENFPSSVQWYLKALELRQQIQDVKGEAATLNNIGLIFSETGNYAEALNYLQRAIEIKKTIGDELGLTASYDNIGGLFQKQLDYRKAIETYYESLKISERLNDPKRMAVTYQNIGAVHFAQGDSTEALKMFEKALALKKNSGDYQSVAQLMNNIAVMLQQAGKTDEAIQYYKECISVSNKNDYRAGLSAANNNLGEIFLQQKNTEEAIQAFRICLELAEKSGNVTELMTAEMNMGEALMEQGNFDEAEKYLLSSLKKFTDTAHEQGFYILHKILSNLYVKKNDLLKALEHFRIYDELKGKQLNTDNSTIIHELKTKYEVDKKEKENEINRLRNIELKDALEDLTIEKRRSEKLLLNILPEEIAYELKRNGKVKAQSFASVSVLFADIKSFTTHSENLSPETLVGLLDLYFQLFDSIMQQHDIEKIKTIGDAYLCVCGLPNENPAHAVQIVTAAMEMQRAVGEENAKRKAEGLPFFEFRIGIHSGAVIAGIVGRTKFEYDIWGDTVNTAARMEQTGEAGKINISESTYALVKDRFTCTPRGKITAKNKGEMDMYFVHS